MSPRYLSRLAATALGFGLWTCLSMPVQAQYRNPADYQYPPPQELRPMDRLYYYPYYYFPASYWPALGPKWPEPVGAPYMRPPAYQAFPPFREPHWRYEYWEPQYYYRGNHFLLDVF